MNPAHYTTREMKVSPACRSFGVVNVFILAQTCRALHEATEQERRTLSGRIVVYQPPLSSAQAYMMKYRLKERPSRVETMVYVHMLMHG